MIERDDTTAAVHPGWRDRLQALMKEGNYGLTSVWRSRDLQAHWFKCAQNNCSVRGRRPCHGTPGDCPSANPAGTSNHEFTEGEVAAALAVDLRDLRGDRFAEAHRLAAKHRLHFPIPSEPWHVQPLEVPGRQMPARSPFPGIQITRRPPPPPDPFEELFLIIAAS